MFIISESLSSIQTTVVHSVFLTSLCSFSANQVLNEEAQTWVKNCCQKIYQLLKETPPEGEKFAESIEVTKRKFISIVRYMTNNNFY